MSAAIDAPLNIAVAAIITFLTALAISRFTMRAKILPDNPNPRSSHDQVTSRAGGVGIFVAWVVGMIIFGGFSSAPALALLFAKFTGLTLIAFLVGLADDRWALSPLLKFLGQTIAALLFVWAFGPLQTIPVPLVGTVELGVATGTTVTVLWIVAFMNFFNFMDGVNGIAAGTAAIGLIAFSLIGAFAGALDAAVMAILLSIACFGFLPANLRKGRLFMGDSGSMAISFVIAGLGVYAANGSASQISPLVTPVIFLPFLFDVAWTLAHRLVRKQNILSAHREHLYQLLVQQGYSHAKVATLYIALTAVSAAAAILMLTMAPEAQWLVPAGLAIILVYPALRIFSSAAKAGMLAAPRTVAHQAAE